MSRNGQSGSTTSAMVAVMAMLSIGALAAGCAADDTADPEDEIPENTESVESEIKNASIRGTKLCVKVLRNTTLHRDAEGTAMVTTTSHAHGATIVTAADDPRYVLVQPKPGRVGQRVWADPDLNGLRSDKDIPALAKRCRISIKAAKKAAKNVVDNKYTRRGFIDVADLSNDLGASLDPSAPTGPGFSADDRDGKGNLEGGTVRHVKALCLPQGEYVGSDPSNPAGFYTYGTCIDWKLEGKTVACQRWGTEMYLSYGTPEIDGGGLTFGYVAAGQTVHQLDTHVHEQKGDHCQTDDLGGKVLCNGDAKPSDRARRIVWSEIWAKVDGRTLKGWVPEDCLE
jgi:hypothetical protein